MSTELKWYGDQAQKKIDEAVQIGLLAAAIQVKGQAQYLVPVKTGRLRQSITITQPITDKNSILIGTNVEYAPHVEFGTKRQKAQSYLRRAIDEQRENLIEIYNKYFQRALTK
jgi:HK97 gp10 family phage protein